jgi:hypothetical protein
MKPIRDVQVPGHAGNFVLLKDAIRLPLPKDVPYPTFYPSEDEDLDSLEDLVADVGPDPYVKRFAGE